MGAAFKVRTDAIAVTATGATDIAVIDLGYYAGSGQYLSATIRSEVIASSSQGMCNHSSVVSVYSNNAAGTDFYPAPTVTLLGEDYQSPYTGTLTISAVMSDVGVLTITCTSTEVTYPNYDAVVISQISLNNTYLI